MLLVECLLVWERIEERCRAASGVSSIPLLDSAGLMDFYVSYSSSVRKDLDGQFCLTRRFSPIDLVFDFVVGRHVARMAQLNAPRYPNPPNT